MRIGIIGGTFNPIHLGHLIGAEQARSSCSLDEVWFMPAFHPPHKENKHLLSWDHRIAMVQLAIEDDPSMKLITIEKDRKGPSYTFDTVNILKSQYANDHFYFILGTDMVMDLPNWHESSKLSTMISFIGLSRPGYHMTKEQQSNLAAFDIEWISQIEIGISSSVIREMKESGKSIKYLVPPKVYQYIEENNLYG